MRKAVASLSTTRIVFLANFHLPHKNVTGEAAGGENSGGRRPDLNTPSPFLPHEKPPFFLRRKSARVLLIQLCLKSPKNPTHGRSCKNKDRSRTPPKGWKLAGWEGGLAPLKIECHSMLNSIFSRQICI